MRKDYIGRNIKKMYILVTILTTLRFFVKDNEIKQLLILKDVMITFHKIVYLVANFVRVRTYRVVKNRKIISKFLRHYQSKHFSCKSGTKTNSIFQFLIIFPLKRCNFYLSRATQSRDRPFINF